MFKPDFVPEYVDVWSFVRETHRQDVTTIGNSMLRTEGDVEYYKYYVTWEDYVGVVRQPITETQYNKWKMNCLWIQATP